MDDWLIEKWKKQRSALHIDEDFPMGYMPFYDAPFYGLYDMPSPMPPAAVDPLCSWAPVVDIFETRNEIIVRIEVPGVSEKNVELSYGDGVLNIQGFKTEEFEENKMDIRRNECDYGHFTRNIPIKHKVDWAKAGSSCHNGVFTVMLPKATNAANATKIPVKSGK